MRAIVEHTPEQYKELLDKFNKLKEATKGVALTDLITKSITRGYAHYRYYGEYTDKLVELLGREPDSDEIIMLVDDGFSHFGATCRITGKRFEGRVNTD